MKVTQKILNRTVKTNEIPTVYVEKSSVSPNGAYAKVLFRVATSSERSKSLIKDRAHLVEAFDAKLQGNARLVVSSVHASEIPDMYCAFVKLNSERMSFDMGAAKNFRSITANMFADPDDNLWNLEESTEGKILVRTSEDNLQDLLNTRISSPSLSVAAAGYALNGIVTAGQLVAYYDNANEEIRKGMMLDNQSVFNFQSNKVVEVASCDLVASTPVFDKAVVASLDAIYGDKNTTYKELAANSSKKAALVRYVTALYGQNKAFLDAYLRKIDELLEL